MPALTAFMKIPHRQSTLADHLSDMRRFMPLEHRQLIAELEALPPVRDLADPEACNEVLEAMANIPRGSLHLGARIRQPLGGRSARNGGAPYMVWLRQLIEETRLHKLAP